MKDVYFRMTRGKLKDVELKVDQICNNWVTAKIVDDDEDANNGQPLSLRSAYFPGTVDRAAIIAMHYQGRLGQMFKLYYDIDEFIITGKLKPIRSK